MYSYFIVRTLFFFVYRDMEYNNNEKKLNKCWKSKAEENDNGLLISNA